MQRLNVLLFPRPMWSDTKMMGIVAWRRVWFGPVEYYFFEINDACHFFVSATSLAAPAGRVPFDSRVRFGVWFVDDRCRVLGLNSSPGTTIPIFFVTAWPKRARSRCLISMHFSTCGHLFHHRLWIHLAIVRTTLFHERCSDKAQ
jgi:hypothetical protein